MPDLSKQIKENKRKKALYDRKYMRNYRAQYTAESLGFHKAAEKAEKRMTAADAKAMQYRPKNKRKDSRVHSTGTDT